MQIPKILAAALVALFVMSSLVIAMHHTPEERGKALFNDAKLGGGTADRSCNTCHPGGKGLFGVGEKALWKTPGGEFRTLEEAVNICITMALKGKALDVKSDQMKEIVSYLKTLKAKTGETQKKDTKMGC